MKKILYSPGEPSGIGPDLIIQICSTPFWEKIHIPIVCLADKKLIQDRAKVLNKKIKIDVLNNLDSANQNKFGVIQIKEVSKCRISSVHRICAHNDWSCGEESRGQGAERSLHRKWHREQRTQDTTYTAHTRGRT